jgi:FkbM family methyltransferase
MNFNLYNSVRSIKRYVFLRYEFWRDYFSTGEWELREIGQFVKSDRMSIDVGGNIGVYTYHLHRLSSEVVTFEPNPQYVEVINDLGLRRGRIEAVALSDQSGNVTLRVPKLASGLEDRGMASIEPSVVSDEALSRAIVVPMRRLDEYGFKNVGFIKIDVEGHEEGVLAGALETIRSNKPALLIEIEERHNPGGIKRIETLLATLGYQGFFYEMGQKTSLAGFDIGRLQSAPPDIKAKKDRRSGGYINNFLFVANA